MHRPVNQADEEVEPFYVLTYNDMNKTKLQCPNQVIVSMLFVQGPGNERGGTPVNFCRQLGVLSYEHIFYENQTDME